MSTITEELDVEYITVLIQKILDKQHNSPNKRHINPYNDRINFACPICGDSQKSSSKKRGNLYLSNLRYVCFNDESCSCSLTRFFDRFGVQMDIEKKLQMYEYLDKHIQFKKDDVTIKSLDKLYDVETLCNFFNDNPEHKLTKLTPLIKGSGVSTYVKVIRGIKYTEDIFEGVFHLTEKWKQPVMVFLNRLGDKVISMQVRNLLSDDKRFFKIMDYSYIYDMMYKENELNLDQQERLSYDKLSHFFNIFNVDFTRTVTMFEGYIDSLSISNSIGQIGVNTDISFLLNEDVKMRFVYDNDKAGFKKAEKMLIEGHDVFLWNKFFIDLLKKHKGNKREMAAKLKESIKDFNNLSRKVNKPLYEMYDIDSYFSHDELDRMYFTDLDKLLHMV